MTATAADLAVLPVRTRGDRQRFLRFPWRIYGRTSPWVPPLLSELAELLDPGRHPFHRHARMELFLARRGEEVVGRIAAIVNQAHLDAHRDGVGFFGFFEAVNDPAVAAALLDAAADWLAARGLRTLRGPMNPSINDEVGLLLDDFAGRPVFMMPYTPPYYVTLLEQNGLVRVRELYAYLATRAHHPTARQERLAEHLQRRHAITIRNGRLKEAEREAAVIESIYNRAWDDLWGSVPLTHAEVVYLTRKLRPLIDERLVLIAAVNGEPAGFALAVPDFNEVLAHLDGRLGPVGLLKALYYRRRIRRLRLMALGVVREHRRKGIETLLAQEILRRGIAAGYEEMEISWVLEDNGPANNLLRNIGVPRYRTYGIFERPIPAA
jgi:GNAT superfamily N-acetyltransferase